MTPTTDVPVLTDAEGRMRVLHGVELPAPAAGGELTSPWTAADLEQLAELGLDAVRVGSGLPTETVEQLRALTSAAGLTLLLAGAGDAAGAAVRELAGDEPLDEDLLDVLDQDVTSWIYTGWEPGFATSEVARGLRRPRPVAVAGTGLRSGRSAGGSWKAAWDGAEASAPSELWVPEELDVEVVVDGARTATTREGARVLVPAGPGEHRLRVS